MGSDIISSTQAEDASSIILRFVVSLKTIHEANPADTAWLIYGMHSNHLESALLLTVHSTIATRTLVELGAVLTDKFMPCYSKVLDFFVQAMSSQPKTSVLRELLQLHLKVCSLVS